MSRNSKKKRLKKRAAALRKNNQRREEQIRERSKVPTIFLDESGNTGPNLLDPDQPIFSLASCAFSVSDASKLLRLVDTKAEGEIHFKKLRRRRAGQDGIIRLMRSSLIAPKNVKAHVFLKEFMVLTKIVDTLIEHMYYLNGRDLYINGQNIALSNMLYNCLPAFCGEGRVREMYERFVRMIKDQSDENIADFYTSVEDVKKASIHEKFKSTIDVILATRGYAEDALEAVDKTTLDPAIPALFAQCASWGDKYPRGFHLIHDDSHAIEKQKLLFAKFMDWTKPDAEFGYDRRKFKLPLKGKSLNFASSEEYLQLQVADIIASSFSYWAAGIARGEDQDRLFLELDKLNLHRFFVDSKVWPSKSVDPEELGTVYDGGINPADHVPLFLEDANPNPLVG